METPREHQNGYITTSLSLLRKSVYNTVTVRPRWYVLLSLLILFIVICFAAYDIFFWLFPQDPVLLADGDPIEELVPFSKQKPHLGLLAIVLIAFPVLVFLALINTHFKGLREWGFMTFNATVTGGLATLLCLFIFFNYYHPVKAFHVLETASSQLEDFRKYMEEKNTAPHHYDQYMLPLFSLLKKSGKLYLTQNQENAVIRQLFDVEKLFYSKISGMATIKNELKNCNSSSLLMQVSKKGALPFGIHAIILHRKHIIRELNVVLQNIFHPEPPVISKLSDIETNYSNRHVYNPHIIEKEVRALNRNKTVCIYLTKNYFINMIYSSMVRLDLIKYAGIKYITEVVEDFPRKKIQLIATGRL